MTHRERGPASIPSGREGGAVIARMHSPAIGGELRYLLRVPSGRGPHPLLLLLHGRGDSAETWMPVLDDLPPATVVVAPDAPWLGRAGYWIDSAHPQGRSIETAIVRDLLGALESEVPIARGPEERIVAGYSMGGAGAVRLGLAHPDLFRTVIALSPAIYDPDPPPGSSARESGAFGSATRQYDPAVYARLGYRAALAQYPAGARTRLLVGVGDAEPPHPGAPESAQVGAQVAALVGCANRVPGVRATLRILPGGHDWDLWRPALRWALSAARDTSGARPPG